MTRREESLTKQLSLFCRHLEIVVDSSIVAVDVAQKIAVRARLRNSPKPRAKIASPF